MTIIKDTRKCLINRITFSSIDKLILHLHCISYDVQIKWGGSFNICPAPRWSLNLLAFKFLDAFCCSCELLLQLVTVLFQHFLFLFCGYETSEERTTSTPAAATATSQSSRHSLASSWFATHFSSPPSYKIRHCADHVSKHIKIVALHDKTRADIVQV